MGDKKMVSKDVTASRRPVSPREFVLIAALSIATTAALAGVGQGQASASAAPSTAQNADTNGNAAPTSQDSLAEAARKAKAQKAQAAAAKPARVFTNDNLPTDGVISTVGTTPAKGATDAGGAAGAATGSEKGEKYWRGKFAGLHKKLDQDQSELDVLQREMGVLNLQDYNDPVKAMQQGYSRSDIQGKTDDIEKKKKDVADDRQAISDAEEDLRKSGGDASWSQ